MARPETPHSGADEKRLAPELESTRKYALLSVSDKTGVTDLAKTIEGLGYTIISSGGTAKALSENGIAVTPVEKITGNPECFEGRMKTISFQVEGGILFDRKKPAHVEEAEKLNVPHIDIVVCNLYPFEKTVQKPGVTLDDAIEQIDVGGPTMTRSGAKNFKNVLVVVDPDDYQRVREALKTNTVTKELRQELAIKAFRHLSFYDGQIANFLERNLRPNETTFPEEMALPIRKAFDLRYGENPDQKGAVYFYPDTNEPLKNIQRLAGRELGLVNIKDIDAGLKSVRMFQEPAAVVIKHHSPCGIALGANYAEALQRAIEGDPESAFGGVVVLNGRFDLATAKVIEAFNKEGRGNMDIVAAPHIDADALELLKAVRKSTGVYTFGDIPKPDPKAYDFKALDGGVALQTPNNDIESQFKNWEIATQVKPTQKQLEQMQIGWKFITRIKSNTVLVMDGDLPMTRGIGAGQTSRLRSTKISLEQASGRKDEQTIEQALENAGQHAKGAILISDSFFPFDDSVRLATKYGIAAIAQQGESVNDKDSIKAANEAGIAMVFTHHRAFWH